ncbi:hypothetical protein [Nostoc sp. UHCC 0302]|uniref:hypothetical protein n=1 Tax=Nostoc sp. UHCC 0302 TaxID=3134896 RepID=UPI00311CC33F
MDLDRYSLNIAAEKYRGLRGATKQCNSTAVAPFPCVMALSKFLVFLRKTFQQPR